VPPAKLPAGRKTLVREENSLEQRWCAEKESSENVASIGSSQDSRLRGRHKRSDTIRVTACLVGYGCSNRDILPRLAECVRTIARGLVVVTGHIPRTASGAGAGLDFEFKERRPRRKVAMETGPFAGEPCSNVDCSRNAFPRIVGQCCLGRHRALKGATRVGIASKVR
jgi:hypothetical protein